MEPVPVLLVTWNRLAYTKRAYESIVSRPGVPIKLHIWDNGSDARTVYWLNYEIELSSKDILINGRNEGLAKAMNWFFERNANAQFVVKVDNDTVLPDNWLADLLEPMQYAKDMKLGAVSGTCLRPNGWTFKEWVEQAMVTKPFNEHLLHFNEYVCGTGVVINMDMIRARGLLFEGFPCPIAGWTDYTRIASQEGWKFAFYSKVHLNLLNLKAEHELSGDFPEYDQMMFEMREEGNRWWTDIGGVEGVKKFIAENGGLRRLLGPPHDEQMEQYRRDSESVRRFGESQRRRKGGHLTHSEDRAEKATQEYWRQRVSNLGRHRSSFVDTPMKRVNEFTRIHMEILRHEITGKDVLEVGCGWGRMASALSHMAHTYLGVDFVPDLVEFARASFPELRFAVADARNLPYESGSFDAVVSLNCAVAFDANYDETLKELKRVLRPGGFVLILEELWSLKEWSLPA